MFSTNEIKTFVNGLLSNKSKDILPYWYDFSKGQHPLREVIVINDGKKVINKKRNSIFYIQQPTSIEIQIISSSSYPTNK
jgi:hypothetical protein